MDKGVIRMNHRYPLVERFMRRKISLTKYEAINRRNLEFDITYIDLLKLWDSQEGRCAISNNELELMHGGSFMGKLNPYTCTIDRKDNSKGYTKDNIQLIICAHNFWRNKMPLDEYKRLLGK